MSADRAPIAAIYDAHGAALAAFALNLTRCEADARDIVQEIFCRLAREPSLLAKAHNPRAFLLTMAYRMVVDLHRRQAVRSGHGAEPVELFVPAANPDEVHFREAVAEAMAGLPADQRAVVHLKLWEALTFEQIAETLGIPPNTAASRYRYGIDKLRTLLRPVYEEML
jgi:RNA polymerase sigma-70 factor (ECF subfamily)